MKINCLIAEHNGAEKLQAAKKIMRLIYPSAIIIVSFAAPGDDPPPTILVCDYSTRTKPQKVEEKVRSLFKTLEIY